MADKKEVPERIQKLLKQLCDAYEAEDRSIRERQILKYRRLKLYWDNFTNVYYDDVAHDWRIYDSQSELNDGQAAYYDKPINLFRAYLESIIAALSVNVPPITCYPDDAENPLDLSTAKAGNQIAELIYRHNDAPLLWLHALFVFVTEGMIACYSYPKEDEAYGTYEDKEYETSAEDNYICPFCQATIPDDIFTERELDEYMPDDNDVLLHDLIINQHEIVCPECAQMLDPDLQKSTLIVERLVGITHKPKSRQCLEVYGGLFVKVANYARKQADTPYLRFAYEAHYTAAIERYPNLLDRLSKKNKITPGLSGSYDSYERWGRLSPQYHGDFPDNVVTVNSTWLRPFSYNALNDEKDIAELKKLYPDGCKVVFINDIFAAACNESLDDCWTLTQDPLSDYLHQEPLGMLLTSVQDITNELISLTLQTIEHGIPQTFADPSVMNFKAYEESSVTVGGIYPTIPRAGKEVGQAFHEVKTAQLSGEVLPFGEQIQQMGQMASGALPSIFGGAATQGSKTAAEYQMSRAMALQRLQTTWKMITFWWKNIFGKVIPAFIEDMVEDERQVRKDDQGNFINAFIRKSELEGKIGSIELEASENLPITWQQQKDIIMMLMQAGNPLVLEALAMPENLPYLVEAVGLTKFKLPGEETRQKQFEEIRQLLASEPLPGDIPSVMPDIILDDHVLESEICRNWLISETGRQCKIDNPLGYKNVLLHMKAHMMIVATSVQMAPPPMDNAAPGGKPKPQNNGLAAPVNKGTEDANRQSTIQ